MINRLSNGQVKIGFYFCRNWKRQVEGGFAFFIDFFELSIDCYFGSEDIQIDLKLKDLFSVGLSTLFGFDLFFYDLREFGK